MLRYAVVFFVIALIASLLGFGGVAGTSAEIGWTCAVIAALFLVVAVLGSRVADALSQFRAIVLAHTAAPDTTMTYCTVGTARHTGRPHGAGGPLRTRTE